MHHRCAKPSPEGEGLIENSYELFDVRFDEPQELIQIAGRGGEDICCIFVFRFANRFAHIVRHNRVAVRQLFQVILNGMDIQRIAFQRGFAVDHLCGTQRHAA